MIKSAFFINTAWRSKLLLIFLSVLEGTWCPPHAWLAWLLACAHEFSLLACMCPCIFVIFAVGFCFSFGLAYALIKKTNPNNSARFFNVGNTALSNYNLLILSFVIILMIILLPPFYVVHASLLYCKLGLTKAHERVCVKLGTCRLRLSGCPVPKFSPALFPNCHSTGCSNICNHTALFPIVLYFFCGCLLSFSCSSNASTSPHKSRLSENLQLCTCF